MKGGVKFLGHSVHPILIVFPLGLLGTAAIFDVIHWFTANLVFATVSFWMIVAGLIGGAAAALFGWIDWFAIPANTRAKSIGLMHGLANSVVMLTFLGSILMRPGYDEPPGTLPILLSIAGLAIAGVGGWLGGELVERLSVGVHRGAHFDAPSSLVKDEPVGAVTAPIEQE
jgi:uncharacterized membrane protein